VSKRPSSGPQLGGITGAVPLGAWKEGANTGGAAGWNHHGDARRLEVKKLSACLLPPQHFSSGKTDSRMTLSREFTGFPPACKWPPLHFPRAGPVLFFFSPKVKCDIKNKCHNIIFHFFGMPQSVLQSWSLNINEIKMFWQHHFSSGIDMTKKYFTNTFKTSWKVLVTNFNDQARDTQEKTLAL